MWGELSKLDPLSTTPSTHIKPVLKPCCNVEVVGVGRGAVWGTGLAAGEAKVAGGGGVDPPPPPARGGWVRGRSDYKKVLLR